MGQPRRRRPPLRLLHRRVRRPGRRHQRGPLDGGSESAGARPTAWPRHPRVQARYPRQPLERQLPRSARPLQLRHARLSAASVRSTCTRGARPSSNICSARPSSDSSASSWSSWAAAPRRAVRTARYADTASTPPRPARRQGRSTAASARRSRPTHRRRRLAPVEQQPLHRPRDPGAACGRTPAGAAGRWRAAAPPPWAPGTGSRAPSPRRPATIRHPPPARRQPAPTPGHDRPPRRDASPAPKPPPPPVAGTPVPMPPTATPTTKPPRPRPVAIPPPPPPPPPPPASFRFPRSDRDPGRRQATTHE
jgi:hypothetical protein